MRECLLCERDMSKSKNTFGNGCINNMFKFLKISKPARCKDKEEFIYKEIMRRNDISKANKQQRIWIADRYLTYQYIDKLHYGNFSRLKQQINEDIQYANKIDRAERLATMKKISLKEAYDLYKREQKFNTNIEKINNKEFETPNELKLLITGVSFIFNINRIKNQYIQNSFKKMQYAFWETVIEVGKKNFKFDISTDFLQHSLENNPEDLFITNGKVVDEIEKDDEFKAKLKQIIETYGQNKTIFIAKGDDVNIHFNNNDLYFSIHTAKQVVEGRKNINNKWDIVVKFNDTYDYTEFKDFAKYYNDTNNVIKSIVSSTLYNFAHISMKCGVMHEYEIDIEIRIDDYELN